MAYVKELLWQLQSGMKNRISTEAFFCLFCSKKGSKVRIGFPSIAFSLRKCAIRLQNIFDKGLVIETMRFHSFNWVAMFQNHRDLTTHKRTRKKSAVQELTACWKNGVVSSQ